MPPASNPSFEDAGAQPGEAAHWTLVTFVAAERLGAFGPTPVRAVEDFERWSVLQLAFGSTDLALGVFDPLPEGYEDFEEAWDNDHFVRELPIGQMAEGVFDGDAVEAFEHAWANGAFIAEWSAVTAVLALFDAGSSERFETGWLANETYVTAWAAVGTASALFAPGTADRERLEASWPVATTI